MSDVNTNNAQNSFTNALASAYHTATIAYDKLMTPIHEINEYVSEKNNLDKAFAEKTMTEEVYNQNVSDLQTSYFGDDESRKKIADKFEAIQDWQDAHGITEIRQSASNFAGSIKDAFAATSVGKKFEEIKLAAAELGGKNEKSSTEHESAEAADKSDAEKSNGQATTNRTANVDVDLGIEDMSDGISASVEGFEK